MHKQIIPLLALLLLIVTGCGTTGTDLVVNRLDWDPGSRVAEVEIANIGPDDAGEFMVYFNADEFPESRNRRPQVRHNVPGLAGNDILVLQADFAPLAHPDNEYLGNVYQITALADPKSMVVETDEENNFDRTPAVIPSVELYDKDDQLVPANPAPLSDGTSRLPILFVHGHNLVNSMDTDYNYRKNWQDTFENILLSSDLPSFKMALDLPANSGHQIEPYYIRFQDQNRSITLDAAEIGGAIQRILIRHGDPNAQQVKVVIIAYSKGTISTRWYLKNMMPPIQPISEFIAISPPNHGMAFGTAQTNNSLALRQLNNGYDDSCTSFAESRSIDFIERLNGHPIEDTLSGSAPQSIYESEAPFSRAQADPVTEGILYMTLFAPEKDSVGGSAPSDDCQGRIMAKNLAPNAEVIEVPQINDLMSPFIQPEWLVHAATVHTPEIICLSLYTAVHHEAPPDNFTCTMETVDNRDVPLIPF